MVLSTIDALGTIDETTNDWEVKYPKDWHSEVLSEYLLCTVLSVPRTIVFCIQCVVL